MNASKRIIRDISNMNLVNREISWLSFNERVLQEAMDENVPLIERIRFLGIYSNNMDEFYRVRVANLKRLITAGDKKVEGFKGGPQELYNTIRTIVLKQGRKFEETYEELKSALEKSNIYHFDEHSVNKETKEHLSRVFLQEIVHEVVPIILDKNAVFPRLRDKAIYLAVRMESEKRQKIRMALIEIPQTLPRFYRIQQEEKHGVILIDDIIRLHLKHLFAIFAFDDIHAYTFKFTRDAELNLDDDVSMSFIEKMEKSIKLRKKGDPVRLVYDHKMPEDVLEMLQKQLNLVVGSNLIPGGKYHNFKDFMRFPEFGHTELLFPHYQPAAHPLLQNRSSIIKQVLKQDVLLHFPYQRFDHVVDLLREAAIDPKVKAIRINVYRVAPRSQVMNALINAVRNGKQVFVMLELQARFDEENNLYWTEKLKEEGAKVFHGYQGLKIHSKLIQIERESDKKIQLISYIGTGNFNERTSGVYTDLGLITAHKKIGQEVSNVFKMMENSLHPYRFQMLHVSPVNMRQKLMKLIQNEILQAKQGKTARIQLKINNLVDAKMINKLYEASNAGVSIQLIIRGVCCLIPGQKGKSENIEAISIVDRFLEHSRFGIFHNNGEPQYFISSADWMERNLDKRIEVGVPVLDEKVQQELKAIFEMQWNDTVKARIVTKKQENKYRDSSTGSFHSQQELMSYYHQKQGEN